MMVIKGFSRSWGGLALDTEYQNATILDGFQTLPHLYVIHLAQMLLKYSLFSTPNVMEMKFACLGMHCDVKDCIQLVKQIRCTSVWMPQLTMLGFAFLGFETVKDLELAKSVCVKARCKTSPWPKAAWDQHLKIYFTVCCTSMHLFFSSMNKIRRESWH